MQHAIGQTSPLTAPVLLPVLTGPMAVGSWFAPGLKNSGIK